MGKKIYNNEAIAIGGLSLLSDCGGAILILEMEIFMVHLNERDNH
jgi:hypothetical protein